MKTKLQEIKDAASTGNWQRAIKIASKFTRLGKEKEAIMRAHTAFTSPSFLEQLGKNVDECIEAGKLALISRYSL